DTDPSIIPERGINSNAGRAVQERTFEPRTQRIDVAGPNSLIDLRLPQPEKAAPCLDRHRDDADSVGDDNDVIHRGPGYVRRKQRRGLQAETVSLPFG